MSLVAAPLAKVCPSLTRMVGAVALALGMLLWSTSGWAAIKTQVSARTVGVGQPVIVEITATQEDDGPEPSDPRLPVQGQAQVRGPSISTQSRILMHNFNFRSEKNVVARFQVVPTAKGELVLGPGSFAFGNQRVTGERIVVQVVDEPVAPQPDPGARRSPFHPFGGPSGPFGDDSLDDFFNRRRNAFRIPEAPAEYQLEHAADPIAFAEARLSKKSVVVGEPVRLTIVAYGARGDFREQSPTEPSLPRFLSYRALDDAQSEPTYQTQIDGRTYVVKKLREYVLVPLESGRLKVGEMRTVIQSPRGSYPSQGSPLGFSINTLPLTLEVGSPPADGRPPGYLIGDVGSYQIQAQVAPRTIQQGEYVEVVVRVEGIGQVPSQVIVPEGSATVWEQPTISGEPEVRDGKLQGARVLKYPVQVNEAGTVDLGEVRLPYYDARRGRYQVAQARLGEVVVAASPPDGRTATKQGADAGVEPEPSSSGVLPESLPLEPRTRWVPFSPPQRGAIPSWWLAVLVVLPSTAWGVTTLISWWRRWRGRRAQRPANHVKTSLAEARRELSAGQDRAALRVAERALVEAIELHVGLKARGVLRNEIAHELRSRGLELALAGDIERLLVQLEAARYGDVAVTTGDLMDETERFCRRLSKHRAGGAPG